MHEAVTDLVETLESLAEDMGRVIESLELYHRGKADHDTWRQMLIGYRADLRASIHEAEALAFEPPASPTKRKGARHAR